MSRRKLVITLGLWLVSQGTLLVWQGRLANARPEVSCRDWPKALERCCKDCHSSSTEYPLYSYLSPGGFLVCWHVQQGRSALQLDPSDRVKMQHCLDQIEDGLMPPASYVWLHPDSRLSPQEVQELRDFCKSSKKISKRTDGRRVHSSTSKSIFWYRPSAPGRPI